MCIRDRVIHDDYYENYGIEGIEISEMYAGVGTDANVQFPIKMGTVELKGWGTNPTWHERLKQGYYDPVSYTHLKRIRKSIWTDI